MAKSTIRLAREHRNLTAQAAAVRAKTYQGTWSRWENMPIDKHPVGRLRRIARALGGTTVEKLIAGEHR